MGLTDDRYDYGGELFDPMIIKSIPVIYCYAEIADKLLYVKDVRGNDEYNTAVEVLRGITVVANSGKFTMAMLRGIPTVDELAKKIRQI